uniref:RNA-directed RNA polymerase C-terminal domain-containing protein n=1 Tax=Riboviria sp. TaxID=2585031 RepID=A0A8K1U2M1_9VIRU|nr:MAG: hypothetical protein 1 [Riboviria sp.]
MHWLRFQLGKRYNAAQWTLPTDWMSKDHYHQVLTELDPTSSPGIPYCREATTIGQWLQMDPFKRFNQDKADILWHDINRLLSGDYQHHYRVFVKDEVYTPKKVKEGRWRLIIAPSLAVQVAWQMLFGEYYKRIVRKPYSTPSSYGLCYMAGGWRRFDNYLTSNNMDLCIDKSAWDFNSPGWVYQLALDVMFDLLDHPRKVEWKNIAQTLFDDAFKHSLLHFPCGSLFRQNFFGFMKSGLVGTIDLNSFAQVAISDLATFRLRTNQRKIKATGDDTVEEGDADPLYIEQLQLAGCVVKEANKAHQFMGFDVGKNFTPMYPLKHIANILTCGEEERPETIDSYLRIYANCKSQYSRWKKLQKLLGYQTSKTDFSNWFWLNHPDARDRGVVRDLTW